MKVQFDVTVLKSHWHRDCRGGRLLPVPVTPGRCRGGVNVTVDSEFGEMVFWVPPHGFWEDIRE